MRDEQEDKAIRIYFIVLFIFDVVIFAVFCNVWNRHQNEKRNMCTGWYEHICNGMSCRK